jgi:chloramphenicol-sensitive protein RarD
MDRHRLGVTYGLAAYVLWGLLTMYWKELTGLNAFGLIGQRIVWSVVLLGVVVIVTRRVGELRPVLAHRALALRCTVAALLLAANWTCFLWAVTHDNVVETALGYFLAPLGIVALGVCVLHEHLRRAQGIALVLAALAVIVLAAGYGRVPSIALALAVTWSAYGLLKKTVPLDPLMSLTTETVALAPLAVGVIAVTTAAGDGVIAQASTSQLVLVPLAGVVTTVPLLLFAAAAQRVPLTTLGPLQYAVPIINFALGTVIYDEAMPAWRLVGFALVWVALAIFTVDALRATRVRGAPSESLEPELEAVPLEG